MGITEFIVGQLDRIEQTARGAADVSGGTRWEPVGDYTIGTDQGPILDASGLVRTHVVTHDPAHVLAWVAAIRDVTTMHYPAGAADHGLINEGRCVVCVDFHADCDCEQRRWPCPTIRAIARVWADQPGFDEAWR